MSSPNPTSFTQHPSVGTTTTTAPTTPITLLTLPTETLFSILSSTVPGDFTSPATAYSDMTTFNHHSLISRRFRTCIADKGFSESFYKRMITEQLGLGRPADFPVGGGWGALAKLLFRWRRVRDWKGAERVNHLLMENGGEARLEEDPRTYMAINPLMFRDEYLGKPDRVWYPKQRGIVLSPEEALGKTIQATFPRGFYPTGEHPDSPDYSLIWPSIERQYTPGSPPTRYDTDDITIGMTLASCPAVQEMEVVVFLGVWWVGTVEVRNGEGVTVRDVDVAMGKFMDSPITAPKLAHLLRLIPNLTLPQTTSLPPTPATTIREIIQNIAAWNPEILPLVVGGKTGMCFMQQDGEDGDGLILGEMRLEGLFDVGEVEVEEEEGEGGAEGGQEGEGEEGVAMDVDQ